MPDNEPLLRRILEVVVSTQEAVRDTQTAIADTQTAVIDTQGAVRDMKADIKNIQAVNGSLRQRIRMHQAALNDFEATRVSAGEIEALHADLDAAVARIDELAAEVEKLKARP